MRLSCFSVVAYVFSLFVFAFSSWIRAASRSFFYRLFGIIKRIYRVIKSGLSVIETYSICRVAKINGSKNLSCLHFLSNIHIYFVDNSGDQWTYWCFCERSYFPVSLMSSEKKSFLTEAETIPWLQIVPLFTSSVFPHEVSRRVDITRAETIFLFIDVFFKINREV